MGKRVNVHISDEAYAALERLAREKGTSMSEVLRGALALESWVQDTRKSGKRLLVEDKGTVQEVVVR